MSYKVTSQFAVGIDLDSVESEARVPLGTVVDATHPTYGSGKFIYLQGVASTVADDVVVFDTNFATTRAVAASRGPVAVANAAIVANRFGWYQIQGKRRANALTVVANTAAQTSATAGSIDDTTTAGQFIDGMRILSADAGGKADVYLNHPVANGR